MLSSVTGNFGIKGDSIVVDSAELLAVSPVSKQAISPRS